MKIFIALILLSGMQLVCPLNAAAQTWVQTDEFDYWEDQTSHNYSVSGDTGKGSYSVNSNASLRVGASLSVPPESYSKIRLAVTPGTDNIKLSFEMPWTVGGPALYVDGINQGIIPGSATGGNINPASLPPVDIILTGTAGISSDGEVVVKIVDEGSYWTGDSQITRMWIYSDSSTSPNQPPWIGWWRCQNR